MSSNLLCFVFTAANCEIWQHPSLRHDQRKKKLPLPEWLEVTGLLPFLRPINETINGNKMEHILMCFMDASNIWMKMVLLYSDKLKREP